MPNINYATHSAFRLLSHIAKKTFKMKKGILLREYFATTDFQTKIPNILLEKRKIERG